MNKQSTALIVRKPFTMQDVIGRSVVYVITENCPYGVNYGRSVVYTVTVNYLYRDRVRVSIRVSIRVSGRVTDRVRFMVRVRLQILQAMYCYGVNYTMPDVIFRENLRNVKVHFAIFRE